MGRAGGHRRRGRIPRIPGSRLCPRAHARGRRWVVGTMNRTNTMNTTGSPSAIAKVVAVAEALTEHRRLSLIAQVTGLPASTVHRILQELMAQGWVREGEEHDYTLGP